MSTITIGVDLAKSVFSACEMDGGGHVLRRLELRRDAFAVWLAQVPAGTVSAKPHGPCSVATRFRFIVSAKR